MATEQHTSIVIATDSHDGVGHTLQKTVVGLKNNQLLLATPQVVSQGFWKPTVAMASRSLPPFCPIPCSAFVHLVPTGQPGFRLPSLPALEPAGDRPASQVNEGKSAQAQRLYL